MHDVVAIGGSSGSFDTIRHILGQLPTTLPASVLIVNHIGPSVRLINIFGSSSALPIKEAETGERLRPGQVYLAVADAHLLVHEDHLLVRRGPRENLTRPAIDPLFRSVASAYGGRAIGVILSGALNDGSAGLAAIKLCGGLAVVQDPTDADVPAMPESALHAVVADYCVPGKQIGELLPTLVRMPAGPTPPIPSEIQLEVAVAANEISGMALEDSLGTHSPFTCPDCDGALWQVRDDAVLRFRCHVGHAVSADTMLAAKSAAADAILWRLLRTHEERAALARKMIGWVGETEPPAVAAEIARRVSGYEEDAAIVRGMLQRLPRTRDS